MQSHSVSFRFSTLPRVLQDEAYNAVWLVLPACTLSKNVVSTSQTTLKQWKLLIFPGCPPATRQHQPPLRTGSQGASPLPSFSPLPPPPAPAQGPQAARAAPHNRAWTAPAARPAPVPKLARLPSSARGRAVTMATAPRHRPCVACAGGGGGVPWHRPFQEYRCRRWFVPTGRRWT